VRSRSVVGGNGSGKTTLLRSVAGASTPSADCSATTILRTWPSRWRVLAAETALLSVALVALAIRLTRSRT